MSYKRAYLLFNLGKLYCVPQSSIGEFIVKPVLNGMDGAYTHFDDTERVINGNNNSQAKNRRGT